MKCYHCGAPDPESGRTCNDCRRVFAEFACRSSARCEGKGGYGQFGSFCEDCAAVLADIRGRWFSAHGAVLAAERKNGREDVKVNFAAPNAAAPRPKAKRVTREELAEKIAAHVRASDGPQSYTDLGEALGVSRNSSSLKRATELARERGLIALDNGRGFVRV